MNKRGIGTAPIMVFIIIIIFVVVGGIGSYYLTTPKDNIQVQVMNISPSKAETIIENESILILDVRTPDEFENSHIPRALLLPVSEVGNSTILKTLSKEKPVLVYCRSGTRSAWAADYLVQKGFIRVYNLSGGITAWKKQGYPTRKGQENPPSCPCVTARKKEILKFNRIFILIDQPLD